MACEIAACGLGCATTARAAARANAPGAGSTRKPHGAACGATASSTAGAAA